MIELIQFVRLRDINNNTWYIQPKQLDFMVVSPSGNCEVTFMTLENVPLAFEISTDETVKLVNWLQDYAEKLLGYTHSVEDHKPKETK